MVFTPAGNRRQGSNSQVGLKEGTDLIRVFVYGTLLVGESNHHVVAPYVLSVRPGRVRGALFDAGAYPGLVLSGCGSETDVEGEWLVVTQEGLNRMDELEEYYGPDARNDYERVWVRDIRREECEGWIYLWNEPRGYPRINGGSWREYARRKQEHGSML
ncbi:hypothetical protein YDYSG_41550 [Paenibacillus tyrfis]|nr:hypothetical protein YDYSG_41550 [Paenibacillus tyrfis]